MAYKRIDIVGNKYNMLTVVNFSHHDKHRAAYWNCKCDCGNCLPVRAASLRSGHSKSCGCLQKKIVSKINYVHGYCSNKNNHGIPEYNSYQTMIQRCYNPNNTNYINYGAKGIFVCERWRKSFVLFLEDMGKGPSMEHTLDRWPNSKGNYEPTNCRWGTYEEQNSNTSRNVWIEHKGVKMILAKWGRYLKVDVMGIKFHLKKGRPFDWVYNYYVKKHNIDTTIL